MVRLPVDRSTRIAPRSSSKLPYHKHPIYQLRRWLIIIAIIGLFLSIISYSPWYTGVESGFSILFKVASACLALLDVSNYAMQKVQNPDTDPKWPQKITMVFDAGLAALLQLTFFTLLVAYGEPYHGPAIVGPYAALTDFLCSILHGYSFWKQLMARYKEKWLASLEREPCPRCGYLETPGETVTAQHIPHPPHNTFTYAGPSVSIPSSAAVTPESTQRTESQHEESLLLGPDFEYHDEVPEELDPTIDQREQIVTAKGKKRKTASKATQT